MNAICPHCGYDLRQAEPVTSGRFHADPQTGVSIDGTRAPIVPAHHDLIAALMRAGGRALSKAVLADRLSADCSDPDNLIAVHVCRIRATLARLAVPCPIETVRSFGYRWSEPVHAGFPVVIDDPDAGGSEPGAWQRAIERGCLGGAVHGAPVASDIAACPVPLRHGQAWDIYQGPQA